MDDNNYSFTSLSSCLQFNTRDNSWKKVFGMNVERDDAACIVFHGNIVVSGGRDNNYDSLNTVESYDVFRDKWTSMPNMVYSHSDHSLVTVKDKMFVVPHENNNCEVFDNICKKFVAVKSSYTLTSNKAMSIGNKIVIFQHNRSSVVIYDVDKNEWYEESCDATNYFFCFSCVRMPQY